MPKENVEIVRNAFDAFNAFMRGEGAEKAVAALADPEFEYDWPAERDFLSQTTIGVSRGLRVHQASAKQVDRLRLGAA